MMEKKFDSNVLDRLEEVKVGEMLEALSGADSQVRIADLPAVQKLLGSTQNLIYFDLGAKFSSLALLLHAVASSYSTDMHDRDLDLASRLAAKAFELEKLVRMVVPGYVLDAETPSGTRGDLLNAAVAQAAACGLYPMAKGLQELLSSHQHGINSTTPPMVVPTPSADSVAS